MTWKLALVPLAEVRAIWPTVAPMLSKAVYYSGGRTDMRVVFTALTEQRQLLWVAYDDADKAIAAAFTTREAVYARRKALVVDCAGGSKMQAWLPVVLETFRAYARDIGAAGVEMYGRKGWARALKPYGWQQKLVVMEVSAGAPDEES